MYVLKAHQHFTNEYTGIYVIQVELTFKTKYNLVKR